MMKRLFALFLAFVTLLSFAACGPAQQNPDASTPGATEPTVTEPVGTEELFTPEEPQLVNEVYQIYTPNHLVYMAKHPDKKYALCNNIDLEGTVWKPIDNFSGSLTGLIAEVFNFTVSNAVIEAAEGDTALGFIRKNTGEVKEINFENITLTGSGVFTGNAGIVVGDCDTKLVDVDARNCSLQLTVKDANVGILAGKAAETVSGCYTSGKLNVTLAGGKNYVAGAVGHSVMDVSNVEAHVDVTVDETVKSAGAVGGVFGYTKGKASAPTYGGHFKVTADPAISIGALVGELEGKLITGYNCARSNVVNGVAVKDHFGAASTGKYTGCVYRDLSNIEETLSDAEYTMRMHMVDYMYQMCSVVWRPVENMATACNNHATCRNIYKAGQVYVGMPYTHEGGTMGSFLSCVDESGNVKAGVADTEWYFLMGNDCMDAVCWAWSLYSGSFDFYDTKLAVCVNGAIPVGDYDITSNTHTKAICDSNSAQKMYEAYAQVLPGDALLTRGDTSGHIRMAAESAYVFRNEKGTIDPFKSYIVQHEQGASSDADGRHSTCAINKKYTFSQLLAANYIPITTAEIKAATPAKLEVTCTNTAPDKSSLGKGDIVSSHRLNRIILRITDANGAVVYNNAVYPFGGRAECKSYSLQKDFATDISKLSFNSGAQYTYEVLVLAAGQEVCVQTYQFTA